MSREHELDEIKQDLEWIKDVLQKLEIANNDRGNQIHMHHHMIEELRRTIEKINTIHEQDSQHHRQFQILAIQIMERFKQMVYIVVVTHLIMWVNLLLR